jgi:hypothetical protein
MRVTPRLTDGNTAPGPVHESEGASYRMRRGVAAMSISARASGCPNPEGLSWQPHTGLGGDLFEPAEEP